MALIENTLKWSMVGVVALMVLSGVGSALFAGAMNLMSDPTFILLMFAGLLFFGALLGIPLVAVGVWLYRWWRLASIQEERTKEFVAPDEHGRLPVPASLLRTAEFAHRAMDVHTASYLGNLSTFNYSPQHSQTLNGADGQAMTTAIATNAPGTFWQLYQGGQLPRKGFLMGYTLDDNSEPITADWRDLYSALIGGKSGTGKSTLIRSILAQSAMQGGRFVVVDPHYGAGEESLGASLQPLRTLLLCDIAADERQMIDALGYVSAIGQRRLKGVDPERWPLVLVVDETTALFQRSQVSHQLARVLGEISQETRKVGVYALCIGQNFDGRIMDTTIRNSFVSMLSMPARRDVARVQSGNTEFGRMAEALKIGQCVWLTPTGDLYRLAVPNCTQQDLELVARQFGAKTIYTAPEGALPEVRDGSTIGSTIGSESLADTYLERHFPNARTDQRTDKASASELVDELANDERATHAVRLFLDGVSNSEIVAELWGATSGDKKMRALQELNGILRSHMIRLGVNNNG
jgi:hypothetical protein